jgi:ribulose-phosphate 3-epimerase
MPREIEPSLLAFNLNDLDNQLEVVKKLGCHIIHYDVMDNKFVPNKAFDIEHLEKIAIHSLKTNVHFMVSRPLKYIRRFIKYPLNSITFHPEAVSRLSTKIIIEFLKLHKIPYGIALKPDTNIAKYSHILKHCNYVLIMGVQPGFGGQSFIKSSLENLIYVNKIKEKYNEKLIIQLDGGVNIDVIKQTFPYVNHYIIGTFLMNNLNNTEIINQLFDVVK